MSKRKTWKEYSDNSPLSVHSSLAKRWYGLAAPFYDFIKKLLFPRIDVITDECISVLPPAKEILIVGGGTGNMLTRFTHHFPDSNITFLDISEAMIALAKKKSNRVTFIREDFFHFEPKGTYDLVFYPFFLDHFSEDTLSQIAERSHSFLKKNGMVAIVDFHFTNNQPALAITLKLARQLLKLSITKLEDPIPVFKKHFPKKVIYKVDENTEFFFTVRQKMA